MGWGEGRGWERGGGLSPTLLKPGGQSSLVFLCIHVIVITACTPGKLLGATWSSVTVQAPLAVISLAGLIPQIVNRTTCTCKNRAFDSTNVVPHCGLRAGSKVAEIDCNYTPGREE